MVWRAAFIGLILTLTSSPVMSRNMPGQVSSGTVTVDRWIQPAASASEADKTRSARYGLGMSEADFTGDEADGISIRWRLTKLKMRVPFSTSGLE
jgi:hypothetical protein